MANAVGWHTLQCRGAGCGTVFLICGSCYRGQAYCGAACRAQAQRQQRRAANARHQRSEAGRLDHRDHQRAYRARCRLRRVTDTPSPTRPPSPTITKPVRQLAIRPICIVCGRVWNAPRPPRPSAVMTRHVRDLRGFTAVAGEGVYEAVDSAAVRTQLSELGVPFTHRVEPAVDPSQRERLEAIRRWYTHDWSKLDKKVRTTIVEGLSVFLSVFDLPDVAAVFCPPDPGSSSKTASDGDREDSGPAVGEDAENAPLRGSASGVVGVMHPLPPLDEAIESGTVIALNMPAGTNSALARAVGVMLKQAWLHTLLRRPALMHRSPNRVFRPVMFLCDEYQSFATVGEEDPSGDEKAFALTRQCRLVPIVATQSISSLRAVLGRSEAWRALLQTLRTRIFLSLSDDASAQIASGLCGQVARMKASYTVSEQTARASASLLSGSAGGGTGSVGTSKAFAERREPLFHPRDFTLLGNCQAIVQPYDGSQSLDAMRCYLKPDFLPRTRPYWRARAAGEL